MSSKSPLARVKEEFGGKDKLVDKLVGLVDPGDESKDELRKRLLGAANSKLIKLFGVATKVKQQGGHDKLVAATAESLGRTKDKDYVEKLSSFADARLVDIWQAAERRKRRSGNGAASAAGAGAKSDNGPDKGSKKKPAATRGARSAKSTAEKSA
jgi:hypothetical protein